MPTTQKQSCYITLPGVTGMYHYTYEAPPVCPVPLQNDVPTRLRKADGTEVTWWLNGWITRFAPDETKTEWIPRPTLEDAIVHASKAEGRKFFQFRSNGDIIAWFCDEPLFFSGKKEEVAAEEGIVLPPPHWCRCDEDGYENGGRWYWDSMSPICYGCNYVEEDRWSDDDRSSYCECCYRHD